MQDNSGSHYTLEQEELTARLLEQDTGNDDQIDLEDAIREMQDAEEVRIEI